MLVYMYMYAYVCVRISLYLILLFVVQNFAHFLKISHRLLYCFWQMHIIIYIYLHLYMYTFTHMKMHMYAYLHILHDLVYMYVVVCYQLTTSEMQILLFHKLY